MDTKQIKVTRKKKLTIIAFWSLGFIANYMLFLPIKGDMFSHYPAVYGYIFATLLIIWGTVTLSKSLSVSIAKQFTTFIILVGIIFPILGIVYNGRSYYVNNAAEYNYPIILNLLLDTSNKQELNTALFFAKRGSNLEIAKDLIEKGADGRD